MDLITIPAKIEKQDVQFKFRPMTIEEATTWGSKMKARMTVYESFTKQMEMMEKGPPEEMDAEKYLKITDTQLQMVQEITKLGKDVGRFINSPDQKTIEEYMKKDFNGMLTVLLQYLDRLYPTEEEAKKS